jgi:hypothetical protein
MARAATAVTISSRSRRAGARSFTVSTRSVSSSGTKTGIGNDDVPMNVQIEARSETLAEGDGRAFGTLEAERPRSLALPALDLVNEDAADGRQRIGLGGEQQAELEGYGQYLLP